MSAPCWAHSLETRVLPGEGNEIAIPLGSGGNLHIAGRWEAPEPVGKFRFPGCSEDENSQRWPWTRKRRARLDLSNWEELWWQASVSNVFSKEMSASSQKRRITS
jgi:hypothetical protein